jgi:nicotinamide-nucleotide amidase
LKKVTASIITIGDEILIGQVTDTNSQWIANELTKIGITVEQMISISDEAKTITASITNNKSDLIILTGGLGPTKDDITKHTLTKYFSSTLTIHQPTLNKLISSYSSRNKELNDLNKTQALVPQNCTVLENEFGTAPGMWFQENNQTTISLPGVPLEMKKLLELQVLPKIKEHFSTPYIYQRTLHTIGIPESNLAIKLANWEQTLPEGISLAYLPTLGMVRLRLTVYDKNKEKAHELLNPYIDTIYQEISNYIFGEDNDLLEQVIGNILLDNHQSLATAESCTGGNISKLITSVSGSSKYFNGGIISYSNDVKINSLNIPIETIAKHGAVSEETVTLMAQNVRVLLNSTFGLAVTGIAGPEGGTWEKPVGTVWIAFASENQVITKKLQLTPHRDKNIRLSTVYALDLLRTSTMKHQ